MRAIPVAVFWSAGMVLGLVTGAGRGREEESRNGYDAVSWRNTAYDTRQLQQHLRQGHGLIIRI